MVAQTSASPQPHRALPHHTIECEPWASAAWVDLWWHCSGARPAQKLYWLEDPHQPARWILPLVASRRHGLRRLSGAGGESQRRDLACAPADWPEVAARLVQARHWDWLDVDRMPAATAHGWGQALAAHGCRVLVRPSEQQRYLPLRRPWPQVEQDWSPALRHRLPRHEQALRQRGASLELVTAPAMAAAVFERCLAVEASGWKGRAGTAMLSRPPVAEFYRRLVMTLAAQGMLRLHWLHCRGELLAFDLCVTTPRGLAGLKIGMAESWKKLVPGMVLQLWVLRAAHAAGVAEYDFLGGDDAHKAEWTPHCRRLCRLQAFAPTLRGRLVGLLHRRPASNRLRFPGLGVQPPLGEAQAQPLAGGDGLRVAG